jgi:DNA-binding NarL/FixJ family response regulator
VNQIRVAIVDDHAPYRTVLRRIIERAHDLTVVAEAENGLDAIDMVERLRPEVVLMDLNMPVVDGFDATSIIMEEHPTTRVVTLSMHSLEAVRELALKAGASHFFCKDGSLEDLIATLRDGHQQLDPTDSS